MADRYTSKIALVLDAPAGSVEELVKAAGAAGDVDRGTAVRNEGAEAMEVNWGGRMQRAVIRRVTEDAPDGGEPRHLLRVEAYIGDKGPKEGVKRQAELLRGLARHLDGVSSVVDLDARIEHDLAWLNRIAVSGASFEEMVSHEVDGTGLRWIHTHGAARFDTPDLELYAVTAGRVEAAKLTLRFVHAQLQGGGLATDLKLPDGRDCYLVPVLQSWQHCDMQWPGVGRAGQDRGPGLDGPRATLSVLHRPRFGKFKVDLAGVVDELPTA